LPWPKANPFKLLALQYASKAIFPRARITSVESKMFNSARRYCEQLDISKAVGLLLGGAHLTAATIYAPFKMSPSFLNRLVGIFAKPVRNNAFATQSPELSPVNILPVLFPPCAAGARPMMIKLALRSPNPHTGLDQYSIFLNLLTFLVPTFLMYSDNLIHLLH